MMVRFVYDLVLQPTLRSELCCQLRGKKGMIVNHFDVKTAFLNVKIAEITSRISK